MKPVSTLNMSREEWLKLRDKSIGGSDVSTICGFNPWTSSHKLWEYKTGRTPPGEETPAMRWGNRLEDVVAQAYMEESGEKLIRDNKIRYHAEHEILSANMDRIIPDKKDGRGSGVVEIKTSSLYAYKNWEDEIPVYYYTQGQHYLSITGWTWGIFVIFTLEDKKIHVVPFERDEDLIKKLNDTCISWWQKHIIEDIEPELNVDELNFIKPIIGSQINCNANIFDMYTRLLEAKSRRGVADKEVKGLEKQIKEYMDNNENLVQDGQAICTWKSQEKKEYTVPAKTTRTFRTKNYKGE